MAKANWNDKRDANEKPIIAAFRAAGCVVWTLGREICDLLVLCPDGRLELVEIKNPERKWALTDNEILTRKRLRTQGRELWIVQYPVEAFAVAHNKMELLAAHKISA